MKGVRYLLPAVWKTLFLPPLLVYIALRCLPTWNRPPTILLPPLYLLSLPFAFVLRSHLSLVRSSRKAQNFGARDIPRVAGRWLLNLDIMLDWGRSGSEEEVGWMLKLLGRKYGKTYNTRVLGEDQIVSSDPVVLKHVLLDDFDNFVKGQKFKDRAEGFLGDGIFNSDGERWKFHRNLTRPFFHPAHISPPALSPHCEAFFAGLPDDQPFDMQERLGDLSLNLSVQWLCGENISQSSPTVGSTHWRECRDRVGWALREAQRVVGKRVKIGTIWPLLEIGQDPLGEPMRIIRGFLKPIVQRAAERKASRDTVLRVEAEAGELQLHLIDRLLDTTSDSELIEDQLINLLLASRDTTSSLLTFCTYVLALHPDVLDKLDNEIRAANGLHGVISKELIRECRLCRAFINETLRLFPPIPLNIRRTLRPSLLPTSDPARSPLYMPANTSIILAFLLMQRDPAVFGEDALEFRLERWLDGSIGESERLAFMSWNFGPRMCLGQPLALTIAHCFIIYLIRHLSATQTKLELVPKAQPIGTRVPDAWMNPELGDGRAREGRDKVWIVGDVVLAIKGGLWMKLARKTE